MNHYSNIESYKIRMLNCELGHKIPDRRTCAIWAFASIYLHGINFIQIRNVLWHRVVCLQVKRKTKTNAIINTDISGVRQRQLIICKELRTDLLCLLQWLAGSEAFRVTYPR